ncbi:hypothetical protein BU16DRAFT_160469 [Lophium mytilinum]|uniref:Uncharacterized protein n=1 Tax=Lophium mytilinum TaxID=390894 RepID=A0A6A6QB14_9PEZI|nr:hypothetical protein BU16DRAFT_160469 [Lophium mytilinum]
MVWVKDDFFGSQSSHSATGGSGFSMTWTLGRSRRYCRISTLTSFELIIFVAQSLHLLHRRSEIELVLFELCGQTSHFSFLTLDDRNRPLVRSASGVLLSFVIGLASLLAILSVSFTLIFKVLVSIAEVPLARLQLILCRVHVRGPGLLPHLLVPFHVQHFPGLNREAFLLERYSAWSVLYSTDYKPYDLNQAWFRDLTTKHEESGMRRFTFSILKQRSKRRTQKQEESQSRLTPRPFSQIGGIVEIA